MALAFGSVAHAILRASSPMAQPTRARQKSWAWKERREMLAEIEFVTKPIDLGQFLKVIGQSIEDFWHTIIKLLRGCEE